MDRVKFGVVSVSYMSQSVKVKDHIHISNYSTCHPTMKIRTRMRSRKGMLYWSIFEKLRGRKKLNAYPRSVRLQDLS